MKKRLYIYLSLLIAVVFSLGLTGAAPVQAQEELNTVLAEATARGFLTTLTRPDLADMQNFYVLDNLQQADLLAELEAVTAYEITEADWVSEVSYQVKAVLQPGDREMAIYTGQYNGRWLVEGIDLPSDQAIATATMATTVSADSATSVEIEPVQGNGSGQLVFQTESGGDIYVINADGTGLLWVTTGLDPQLSPDGRQIAFTRWEPRYELFTINLDGSNEQAWTHGWRQMKSPTWSADGATLTFNWQNGGRLEAEQRRINLAEAVRSDDGIDIPDSAVGLEVKDGILNYTIPADFHWSLKQVDLSSGQMKDLGTERHSYGPSGHPTEAGQLIYRGDRGLALHNLETGLDQPITTDARDHTPVISPDGTKIAVSYWQNDHWEIHTMTFDPLTGTGGTDRQRLTSTPLPVLADNRTLTPEFVDGEARYVASENPAWNNAAPVWSPDGSQIAFLTDRTGKWEIWIMNADGSNQRPMFPNGALDGITLNYAGVDERMLSWQS